MNIYGTLVGWFKYQKCRLKQNKKYLYTKQVRQFLQDPEQQTLLTLQERMDCINYLHHHLADMYNAPFVCKYKYRPVNVGINPDNGLYYVITNEGYRLYFKRGTTKRQVRLMYNNLCMEQDKASPHDYCFDDYSVTPDSVIADLGAAEGNFTLRFIDKIKKAYLFESEHEWIEALEATFAPWKEKIVIVNQYVTDVDQNNFITLDTFFQSNEKPTLIKLDIEGAEQKALEGASELLKSGMVSDWLVCLYHRKEDTQLLPEWFRQRDYRVMISQGHILLSHKSGFVTGTLFDFRKGLLHASK